MSRLPEIHNYLVLQEVGSELLVYNPGTHQAHSLNEKAAWVLRSCKEQRTFNELEVSLSSKFSVENGSEFICECLEQFGEKRLLQEPAPAALPRRSFLKQAIGAPLILSLVVPHPAAAASGPCINEGAGGGCNSACTTPGDKPNGGCVPCCNAVCAGQGCNEACGAGNSCTGSCFCLTTVVCASFNCGVGSCLTDPPTALTNINVCDRVGATTAFCRVCNNPGNPFHGQSSCQRDCVRARGAAFCGGVGSVPEFACCENCV